MSATPTSKVTGGGPIAMAIDYGPLAVFFLAYKIAGGGQEGAFPATLAFMVAIAASVAAGLLLLKRVSPMVWLSAVLVIGFGGITLYLHDTRFIQMKPTVVYVLLAAVLLGGLALGKPLIRWLFGSIFPGLDDRGWLKLSRNWALFFLALAVLNEVTRRFFDFETWLTIKVWGGTLLSVVFAAANMPMLFRHGLDLRDAREGVEKMPVE